MRIWNIANLIRPPLLGSSFYVTNLFHKRRPSSILLVDSLTPWMGPLAPWMEKGGVDNEERARNWFAVCCAISIVIHVALLMIYLPKKMGQEASASHPSGPLVVKLSRPAPRGPPATVRPEPIHPEPPRQEVIASKRTSTSTKPLYVPPPPVIPQPNVQQAAPPPEPEDMSTQLAKRRAARGETDPRATTSDGGGQGTPSPDDVVRNNINRSLAMNSRTQGTGGVFQVLSIGVREATLRFNGWHPGSDNHWKETYTVDAGEGGNVHLAVVKKEIEIIRKFYTGDFEWRSDRMGRSIMMSARPADNDQLERFLMREMWSEDGKPG